MATFIGYALIAFIPIAIFILSRPAPDHMARLLRKPDYSKLVIPPGEPEIRMEVAYSTKKMADLHSLPSPDNPIFTTTLFQVATITLFFNDVAKISIQKLGLEDEVLGSSIEAITNKKEQKNYHNAPHVYAAHGWHSPYQKSLPITPKKAFDGPVKLWRKGNADVQGAVAEFKQSVSKLKSYLHAARTPQTQSFEI